MSAEIHLEPLVIDPEGLKQLGVAFSNQHLLRLEASGRWPKRLSLGARSVCWLLAEVKAVIAQRATDRDAAAIERNRAARVGVETRAVRRKTAATGPRSAAVGSEGGQS
jgi:prophage regulatory protein